MKEGIEEAVVEQEQSPQEYRHNSYLLLRVGENRLPGFIYNFYPLNEAAPFDFVIVQ